MNDIDRARLTMIGNQLLEARSKVDVLMTKAQRMALDAIGAGATESEVARLLGVDRMTVRKWRGKR
jgi:DNA-binding CsgD family transcriptional regulator